MNHRVLQEEASLFTDAVAPFEIVFCPCTIVLGAWHAIGPTTALAFDVHQALLTLTWLAASVAHAAEEISLPEELLSLLSNVLADLTTTTIRGALSSY